jgi:hypothetical protein
VKTRREAVALLLAASAGLSHKPLWALGNASDRDLMPLFWAAWDASKTAPDPATALFDAFFQPRLALYQAAGNDLTVEQVRRWLPGFSALAAGVKKLSDRLPSAYAEHEKAFLKALPDYRPEKAQVHFTVSLLRFDGKMTVFEGRPTLLFGLDMIAVFHGVDANLKLLFDHESFHLYHRQVGPWQGQPTQRLSVLEALWLEGLATYASEQMNPGALLGVLLNDKALAAASDEQVKTAASEILPLLGSRKAEDYHRYFKFAAAGVKTSRLGYRVGLEVARRIGTNMPLAQMARLGGPELEERVSAALKAMLAG